MKNRVHRFLGGRKALPMLAAATFCVGFQANAQLSVGSSGLPVQTFDALPAATEWSTIRIPASGGGAGTYTDVAGLDAGVTANASASAITGTLGSSGTQPPSQSELARWNSTGFYLQTRATGSDFVPLLATLQNDSGADQPILIISYDWAQGNPIPVNEHIAGHRVFYSLTGNPNEWTLIPEFSNFDNNSGPNISLTATITLPTPWVNGSRLYILWADDNGPGSTSNPQEGAYSIDNFAISFMAEPVSIVTQPVGRTNNEYSSISLSVTPGGTGPFTYQWSKDGSPIFGATGPNLVITNMAGSGRTWATPTDSGDYSVVVSGATGAPVTSDVAKVLVNADTTAPRFEWALAGTNAVGDMTVRIRLSEPFADPFHFTNDAGFYWFMTDLGGGVFASPLNGVMTSATEVLLTWEPGIVLDPTKSYTLNFTAPDTMSDRAEVPNTFSSADVLVFAHSTPLLSLNAAWKYNDSDVYPGDTWMQPGYDDSNPDWEIGAAPFDTKRNANGTAGANCRDTALHNLGPVGTCILLTSPVTATNITTYYFRTTFNYNGGSAPTNVLLLITGKSDDGHVVYLNGTELERVGMPEGPITNQNVFASRTVGDSDAQDVSYLAYPASIVNGVNTFAVSMHQVNASSSDATLALSVEAITVAPAAPAAPQMSITRGPGANEVTISWTGGGSLYQSSDLGTTASWTEVAGATSPHTVSTSGQRMFFRIQR